MVNWRHLFCPGACLLMRSTDLWDSPRLALSLITLLMPVMQQRTVDQALMA